MFDFNAVMQNTVNRQGFGDGEAPLINFYGRCRWRALSRQIAGPQMKKIF